MNSKTPRVVLPHLNDLLRIDASVELNEAPPATELSTTAHLAGLVAVGGNFRGKSLLHAYENGIFPWPHGEQVDLWFCPVWRGVIDFKDFHVSRSLSKQIKKTNLKFTINRAFKKVIENCSQVPRKGQSGTWIVDDLMKGYLELHKMGYAHSLEAWRDDKLVAGIYGICTGGNFSAESMFGFESNSSKICLVKLCAWLKYSKFKFLDVQMVTPVTRSFGGKYLNRREFLMRLKRLRGRPPNLDFSFVDGALLDR